MNKIAVNNDLVDAVAARWTRLGVLFNVAAAEEAVDIERLLLDTARLAAQNTRLLIMAVTWLARHGVAVAKHRLTQLIRDELEIEHRATLGLLLDLAREASPMNTTRFNAGIEASRGAILNARPLAEVEYKNQFLRRVSEQRASELSRKWGRWMETFELKFDALRPAHWVMARNPELYERQLSGGDLVASVLAEFNTAGTEIESELELARRCGASRPAIHNAILALHAAGRLDIKATGRSHSLRLLQLPLSLTAA